MSMKSFSFYYQLILFGHFLSIFNFKIIFTFNAISKLIVTHYTIGLIVLKLKKKPKYKKHLLIVKMD